MRTRGQTLTEVMVAFGLLALLIGIAVKTYVEFDRNNARIRAELALAAQAANLQQLLIHAPLVRELFFASDPAFRRCLVQGQCPDAGTHVRPDPAIDWAFARETLRIVFVAQSQDVVQLKIEFPGDSLRPAIPLWLSRLPYLDELRSPPNLVCGTGRAIYGIDYSTRSAVCGYPPAPTPTP